MSIRQTIAPRQFAFELRMAIGPGLGAAVEPQYGVVKLRLKVQFSQRQINLIRVDLCAADFKIAVESGCPQRPRQGQIGVEFAAYAIDLCGVRIDEAQ